MAKCKTCKHTNWCKDEGGRRYNWCPIIDDCPDPEASRDCDKHETMTNADRIRAMSDEEMAMNMMCPNENGLAEIECDQSDSCNCYECILKWLQSETEE